MERITALSDLNGSSPDQENPSARLLFEHYEIDSRFFDETFESAEQPRAHYRMLIDEMCWHAAGRGGAAAGPA